MTNHGPIDYKPRNPLGQSNNSNFRDSGYRATPNFQNRQFTPHQPPNKPPSGQPSKEPSPAQKGKRTDEKSDDSDQDDKGDMKQYILGLIRDVVIAIVIMVFLIGGLYMYTGNWPPMVVIESNSMMHGDDSDFDVIDTGDLVLVKKIDSKDDVMSYVEGKKADYKTYGTYGDVIIFRKNGYDDTPVIHRPLVWVIYNASGSYIKHNPPNLPVKKMGSFDIPKLNLWNKTEFTIENYQPKNYDLTVDLKPILDIYERGGVEPHDGFITKGDNNDDADQGALPDKEGQKLRPIKIEWIVGKAEGELPWFGLIKLYIGGETDQPGKKDPETSKNMLILSIALIIAIPITLDFIFSRIIEKRKTKKEEDGSSVQQSPGDGPEIAPKPRFGHSPGPPPRIPKNRPPDQIRPQQGQDPDYISRDDLFKKIK